MDTEAQRAEVTRLNSAEEVAELRLEPGDSDLRLYTLPFRMYLPSKLKRGLGLWTEGQLFE